MNGSWSDRRRKKKSVAVSAAAPGAHLPDRPFKRFVIGSSVLGSVAFIVTALHSSSLKDAAIEASAVAVTIGLTAGFISAFGKKAFAYVMAFAREILSHP